MQSRISARSSAVARSAASVTAPISIARRRSSTSRQSGRRRPPGLVSASGGSCTTNVPPPRPRTDVRCPDSTRVVIAWRSVEREIPSWSASSRSGGSRVPGPRIPRRIAVPRRSTVSSKVVGGWTGSKTAATAASRAMAPTYCARAVRVRARNCPHRRGGRAYTRTMATTPTVIDRARIAELTEREAARLDERTQASKRMYERARDVLTARRRLLLPGARAVADLPRARRGPAGVGRRRQRDVGLPQRLRLDGPGPRAPRDRRRDLRALRPGHPLRRADRGRDRRRRASSRSAGACRAGATRTPARSRRWTRSASPAPTPAATRC